MRGTHHTLPTHFPPNLSSAANAWPTALVSTSNTYNQPITTDTRPYQPTDQASFLVKRALRSSLADSTFKLYDCGVQAFMRFCDTEMVPLGQRIPTPENLLVTFAASYLGTSAGTTVKNKIAALKAFHIMNSLPWDGGALLNQVMRGIEQSAPAKRAPREGVTIDMIICLGRNLDLSDPFDTAVNAAATTALWGQTRLGEILPESISKFDPAKFPTSANIANLAPNRRSCIIHLPWTKTKGRQGDDIYLFNQSGPANPLPALEAHLRANQPGPNTPLFSYRQGNSHRPLTKRAFLQRVNGVLKENALGKIQGHGFRIGGTTELLRAGVHPDVVKKTGRWASDSFLRYWRKCDAIGEAHMADIMSKHNRRRKRQRDPRS